MTPVIIYHFTSPWLSVNLDGELLICSSHLWQRHWVALDWGLILEPIYSFCDLLLVITLRYPSVITLSSIDQLLHWFWIGLIPLIRMLCGKTQFSWLCQFFTTVLSSTKASYLFRTDWTKKVIPFKEKSVVYSISLIV